MSSERDGRPSPGFPTEEDKEPVGGGGRGILVASNQENQHHNRHRDGSHGSSAANHDTSTAPPVKGARTADRGEQHRQHVGDNEAAESVDAAASSDRATGGCPGANRRAAPPKTEAATEVAVEEDSCPICFEASRPLARGPFCSHIASPAWTSCCWDRTCSIHAPMERTAVTTRCASRRKDRAPCADNACRCSICGGSIAQLVVMATEIQPDRSCTLVTRPGTKHLSQDTCTCQPSLSGAAVKARASATAVAAWGGAASISTPPSTQEAPERTIRQGMALPPGTHPLPPGPRPTSTLSAPSRLVPTTTGRRPV